jgi:hypothetical protein
MAGGAGGVDYSAYDTDALKATFLETKETLSNMRQELLSRGYWIDAKYKINAIADLEDDHLSSILRMQKNKSIRRSKYWKGLHDKTWQEFLLEEPVYPFLFAEAQARNLPGAGTLPEVDS